MKLLVFTSLYPNAANPNHGVFVENRLRHLLSVGEVEARVVAPVPWFPFAGARFGRYGAFARVPAAEARFGIPILHPRYPVVPKIGMNIAPQVMAWRMKRPLARLMRDGFDFDVIDAHYFYPDGVAAALLARRFGKPVVITARGSDVNLIAEYPGPRRMMLRAASEAGAVVAVSAALGRRMEALGIPADKIAVLRNGVDLAVFRPLPREPARAALGLACPTLICVGNLLVSKGQDVAIRALALLPGCDLVLVGEGPDEGAFRQLAAALGVADRVRFVGRVAHHDLARFYSAADVLLLASMREGWPNVLLEAMACGTPAVASDVGGVPEIIAAPEAGRVIAERSPNALAEAVRALLAAPPSRAATRAWAERFSWAATSHGLKALLDPIVAQGGFR